MNWDQIGQIWTRIKDGIALQRRMLIDETSRPVELIPARVARGESRYTRGTSVRPTYREDRRGIL